MADTIEILAHAAHGTVPHVRDGFDIRLVGFAYGAIPLAAQRKGSVVDVSAYSTMRATLAVDPPTNRQGWEGGHLPALLHVALEHRFAGKPWQLLYQWRFDPNSGPHRQPVHLTGFGVEVRPSWYFVRHSQPGATILDEVTFTFGISADALPENA